MDAASNAVHGETPALLRMATKLSRLGGWCVDVPNARVTWSDEVCAIHEMPFGYSPTVAEGLAFYAPEHRPAISQAYARCVQDGEPFDLELKVITARGRMVWVRALGEAVRGAGGEISKVQGAFQDITRSRELAEQNKALAEQLVETLESMGDAFFALDRTWRFTYVNRQAELVLERSREEVLGRNVWDEFPEAVGSRFHAAYQAAFAEGRPVRFQEFYPPLGRWFAVNAFPSADILAVYFRDVTESVNSHQALQRAKDELETRVEQRTRELRNLAAELESFSYSVAHDLRAPLASISGYSQVLAERHAGGLDAAGQRYLRKIAGAAQRMDEMISGVLALSRLPHARLRQEPFDLGAAAAQQVERFREMDPYRRVDVRIQQDLHVVGDPLLLHQVVQNLVSNAWKFTSKKPASSIRIGSEAVDGELVYFVEDDGAGFDMAYAHRLFQIFSRHHHESEFPGTGVGLATVHRIVSRHGGRVWADSTPGVGTRISFTLAGPQNRPALTKTGRAPPRAAG